MSASMLLFHDHNDVLQVVDPDTIPQSSSTADVAQEILTALLKNNCEYLAADAHQMVDGRMVVAWSFKQSTSQGKLLHSILHAAMQGVFPPPLARVLEMLKQQ